MTVVLVAAASAFAAIGSSATPPVASAAAAKVRVPKVVGLRESRAECLLYRRGLRWRYAGSSRVHSRPVVGCGGGPVSHDPLIAGQRPRAGRRVCRRSVVVLRARAD